VDSRLWRVFKSRVSVKVRPAGMADDTTLAEIQAAYGASCAKYERLADKRLQKSDTIIISGYGCALRVKNDALVVFPGKTHKDQTQDTSILYRGVHTIKHIILLSGKGVVSLDAIKWASEQGIAINIIDGHGNLIQSLAPEHESDASLRRAQYGASDTGLDVSISRELVRVKTEQQIKTLHVVGEMEFARSTFRPYRKSQVLDRTAIARLKDGLDELATIADIGLLRLFEAKLGLIYWNSFVGIPLRWIKGNRKRIPPHWRVVSERSSSLASNRSAMHATNPFHAVVNYAYAILQGQINQELVSQGFDTACGYLHVNQLHRDSLVFDLMECHRSQVDRVVLNMFATHMLSKGEFMRTTDGSVQFNPQFARFIAASCRIPQSDIESSVSWLKGLLIG